MTFILTRIRVEDYETWKRLFDTDPPNVRTNARGHRLFRGLEDPNEVFIQVEFDSSAEAHAARERLLAAGLLDRFPDVTGPTVVEQAELVAY